MNKAILSIVLVLHLSACSSTNNRTMKEDSVNNIVQKYVDKTTDPADIGWMKKILKDNIAEWVAEYSNMGFYKEEDFVISDIMIFGKDKDKVLLIVYALLADSDDAEAKLLTGRLNNNDGWDFRFTGMPSFYYEYNEELRKGTKFTEAEVLSWTVKNLVDDGLITFYDEISQAYIKNKWF